MGDPIRKLLSISISSLEQGAFQEFCLSFLPLYAERFVGLERHGATAAGKTRKGTPDLIKVNPNGSHICVQCSTETSFWSIPQNPTDWKPVQDIAKCVDKISKIDEIVLCASAEIPTTLPDAKSRIMDYAKIITESRITILSLSTFEEEIRGAVDTYRQVIRNYCPLVYEYEEGLAGKKVAEAKLRMYKKYALPLSLIEQVIERHTKDTIVDVDVSAIEAEIALLQPSRFIRKVLPEPNRVVRASVNDFVTQQLATGSAYVLLGVPKIGKTTWVAQLCKKAVDNGFEICWFDSPHNYEEQSEFVQSVVRTILGLITDPELTNQYVDRKIALSEVAAGLNNLEKRGKILLVVDNTENLDPRVGAGIKDLLDLFKDVRDRISVSVILVSSKSLGPWLGNRAIETFCPSWSSEEIEQLIGCAGIKIADELPSYSQLLAVISGGHPLIAMALARKAPNRGDLFAVKLKSAPALHDEDLTEEIKELLFDDLLSNEDARDFVLRLAPLFLRFDLELMAFVASSISPQLRTPVNLMLARLRGTILEGDDATGYQVAFVFREVAITMLTPEDKIRIYRETAGFLCQPRDGVIDANRGLDGIWYAMLGGDHFLALFWAYGLLPVFNESLTEFQREYMLDRLAIVTALNPPSEQGLKVLYLFILTSLAAVYAEAGNQSHAIGLIKRIAENPLTEKDIPNELGLSHGTVNTVLCFHAALSAARLGQDGISLGLQMANSLDARLFLNLPETEFVTREVFTEMVEGLHILIQLGSPSMFPFDFVRSLCQQLSSQDDLLGNLANWFCTLGWQASMEEGFDIADTMPEAMEKTDSLFDLLKKFAYAQYHLERGERLRATRYCEEIAQLIRQLKVQSSRVLSKMKQLRGDIFYRDKEYDKAILEYQECLSVIQDNPGSFDYAWANYRIGLCFEDNDLAIRHLSVAGACFGQLGFLTMQAKCDGEHAVAVYRKGNIKEAVKILYGIVERYYFGRVREYSSATTVGLASLMAIEAKLKGEPFAETLINGNWHFEFKKRLFEDIPEEATPRAGVCTAYLMFADIFELLGDTKEEIIALYRALEGTPENVMETRAKVWVGLKLVVLLVEKGQETEVYRILCRTFETDIEGHAFQELFWKYYIFTKTEELLKQGKILHKEFAAFLNEVKEVVQHLPNQRRGWWLAEVKMRQAGIDGVTNESDYREESLREALSVARKARNYEVLVQVGHQIGFMHYHGLDFKEIAEAQLAAIVGVCNDAGEISRLQTIGQNMVNFWAGISYNRLKESDLPYWLNLAQRAKRMYKDIPADVHAVLMISFLLIVTGAIVNEDCQKAVFWAKSQLLGNMERISEDDRGYLKKPFDIV